MAPNNTIKSNLNLTFFREYFFIALGLLMYSAAWKAFLLPHTIAGGGATGIAAIIQYATGFQISYSYFIINFILLLIAVKSIGVSFSMRTIFGVAMVTIFLRFLPQAEAGKFVGENDNFMACVLGGLLGGIGLGLVFLNNGSAGGTDIIAKLVNKKRNITLGRVLLYCDVLIISSSYFLNSGKFEPIVYGLTTMAVMTIAVDMMINGVRQSVQFFIFSKEYEHISDRINQELDRGVTVFDGVGWYSKTPVKVITVIARKNESTKIFKIVKEVDPNAFVSQSSVIGVYGEGFDIMKTK